LLIVHLKLAKAYKVKFRVTMGKLSMEVKSMKDRMIKSEFSRGRKIK
jgi:hypothetical protein